MRKIFYVETGAGVGLRAGKSEEEVRAATLAEAGTREGVSLVREATPEDINHVGGFGGKVPDALDLFDDALEEELT